MQTALTTDVLLPPQYEAIVHAQNTLAKLDPKIVAEAYKEFETKSDQHFEDNMKVVTQNIIQIDEYMRHVYKVLLRSDEEIFHDDMPFTVQWRTLHKKFQTALRESQGIAIRLASKIKVFYEDLLPLLEAESSSIPVEQKVEAFKCFANAEDATGVNQSMAEDEATCQRLARDFDDMRIDVASCVASFEGFLRGSGRDCDEKLKRLRQTKEKFDAVYRKASPPNPFNLVGTPVLRLPSFGGPFGWAQAIAPIAMIRDTIGVAQAAASWAGAAHIPPGFFEEKLQMIDDELRAATHLHDNIEELLHHGLPIIHKEVNQMGIKMVVFSEIWAFLRAQAGAVRLNMNNALSLELPELLRPDVIELTRIGYLKLYICVEQYAGNLEPIFGHDS